MNSYELKRIARGIKHRVQSTENIKKLLLVSCCAVFLFDIWFFTQIFSKRHARDTSSPTKQPSQIVSQQPGSVEAAMPIQNPNTTGDNSTPAISDQSKMQTSDLLFKYYDPNTVASERSKSTEYTIVATGDVIPARSVNAAMVRRDNFTFPFEKTVGILRSADAVFINLESPLVAGCQVTTQGMSFCGDQRFIQGLKMSGVTVANIANNHTGNYGISGINQTVELLKENTIAVTGNGESATVTIRGKKFGFLGYNEIGSREDGIAWADVSALTRDIQILKKNVDFVIVGFHWGIEYTSIPSVSQRQLARSAIDAGADLIIGNHPHWVQGVERYKGKHITYAHGNYIFDQMWSQETREGVLGNYVFSDSGLARVEFIPIIIDDYSEARYATEGEAKKILERMAASTKEMLTTGHDVTKE